MFWYLNLFYQIRRGLLFYDSVNFVNRKFHQTISPIGQIVEKDISVSRRVKMANLLQKERRYFVTRSSFCAVCPGIGYNAILFSSRLATNIIKVILQCNCIFNQRDQSHRFSWTLRNYRNNFYPSICHAKQRNDNKNVTNKFILQ